MVDATLVLPQVEGHSATQAQDDDFTAPPSSQPRPVSEDEEMDNTEASFETGEDLLEDFDVGSDEREFLAEMLHVAPKDELEKLKSAKDEAYPDFDKPIRDFAQAHPIYELAPASVDEEALEQFETDVREFSRAAGMPKHKSKLHAQLAVATWKRVVGLGTGVLSIEESDTEPSLGPNLRNARDYYWDAGALVAGKGKKKKKKDNKKKERAQVSAEVGADAERVITFITTAGFEAEGVSIPVTGEKRKRDFLNGVEAQDTVEERKQSKRRRRRLSKAKKDGQNPGYVPNTEPTATSSGVPCGDANELQKIQVGSSSVNDQETLAIQQTSTASNAKPSPTTSKYFAKVQAPLIEQFIPNPATASEAPLPSSNLSRRGRKKEKRAALEAAKSDKPTLAINSRPVPPTHSTIATSELAENGVIETLSDQKPQPMVVDAARTEATDEKIQPHNQPTGEATDVSRKHKRKRKRNHNRLLEVHVESLDVSNDEEGKHHSQQHSKENGIHKLHELHTETAGGVSEIPNFVHVRAEAAQNESIDVLSSRDANTIPSRKRGDRGRVPKFQQSLKQQASFFGEPEMGSTESDNVAAPRQKPERRDRGRKRSSGVEAGTEPDNQELKGHHL